MGHAAMIVDKHTATSTVIVGLGDSGLACVRHLQAEGASVAVMDTRRRPPHVDTLAQNYPEIPLHLGGLSPELLADADRVVLSPGVDPRLPPLQAAARAGIPILGEIELFARAVTAPVVAITGSNGKSTVTRILGAMADAAGIPAAVGGNLGPPALDLLVEQPDASLFVLELSSFQLETTRSLVPVAATVLNLSPDHLDRYDSLDDYAAAKAQILSRARVAVLNADDRAVRAMARSSQTTVWFSSEAPHGAIRWTLQAVEGGVWICRGGEPFLPVDRLAMTGHHNALNALAALALGEAAGLPDEPMRQALVTFPGLPHRMETVGWHRGRLWINDSKATNVGAAVAAIQSANRPVVLIAGGEGKGQSFDALAAALAERGRRAVVYGQDRERLAAALKDVVPVCQVSDLAEAVSEALALSRPGDSVMLAPACASLDQFSSYRARGTRFRELVEALSDGD